MAEQHYQPEETVKEALSRWARKPGYPSLKLQAERLGVAESTMSNSMNPHIDNCHYHARHIVPQTLMLRDFDFLDYLEACVGRVAFLLPEAPGSVADLQSELARTIKEFGDVVTVTGEALSDNRIQRGDVVKIEREVDELVRQALAFKRAVKDRMERF